MVERISHIKLLEYIDSLKKEKYIENYNIEEYDKLVYGLLSKSIMDNKIEEVKYILLDHNIDNDLLSELLYKSIVKNKIEYVKCILPYISDLYVDELNMLLKSSYKYNHIEIAEYLISQGADIEIFEMTASSQK